MRRISSSIAGTSVGTRTRCGGRENWRKSRMMASSRSDSRRTMSMRRRSSPWGSRLPPQDLDRSADRSDRVADLVGQAGRQAPDGREPVRLADLLLHALDVGEVLERADRAAPAPQEGEAHPDRQPGPVGPDELGLRAGPPGGAALQALPDGRKRRRVREQGLPAHSSQLHLAPRAQRLGRPVHRGDGAPPIEGQEPARDALHDVLVERPQGGQAGLAAVRLAPRLAQAARQVRRRGRP